MFARLFIVFFIVTTVHAAKTGQQSNNSKELLNYTVVSQDQMKQWPVDKNRTKSVALFGEGTDRRLNLFNGKFCGIVWQIRLL
jgi:hypothetical protein